jgi:hypothetical protein
MDPADLAIDWRYHSSKCALLDLIRTNPAAASAVTHHLNRFLDSMSHEQPNSVIATTTERQRIDERIRNFDYEKSNAWMELTRRGWDQLSQAELLSIAQIFGKKFTIPIDREAKRRKSVLV